MGLCQMRSSVVLVITMLLLLACCEASSSQQQNHMRKMVDASPSSPSTGGGKGAVHPARHQVSGCSDPEELVRVSQNKSVNLPSGIPSYTVDIFNSCVDCTVCNVHLSCGNWANTGLVDPATFRRLRINDCLVKSGGPIGPGEMVSFEYSNSFPYELKVASASCDCH